MCVRYYRLSLFLSHHFLLKRWHLQSMTHHQHISCLKINNKREHRRTKGQSQAKEVARLYVFLMFSLSFSLSLSSFVNYTPSIYDGILPMWRNMTILFPKPRTQFQIRHLKSKKKITAFIFFSLVQLKQFELLTFFLIRLFVLVIYWNRNDREEKHQQHQQQAIVIAIDAIEQLSIHTIHNRLVNRFVE